MMAYGFSIVDYANTSISENVSAESISHFYTLKLHKQNNIVEGI